MSQGKRRELPRKIPAPPLLSGRCQHSALIQRGGGYRVALGAHCEVPQYPRQACLQGRGAFWERPLSSPWKLSGKRCHTSTWIKPQDPGWAPAQATQQGRPTCLAAATRPQTLEPLAGFEVRRAPPLEATLSQSWAVLLVCPQGRPRSYR